MNMTTNQKQEVGVIHGRFQVFHLDHLAYLLAGASRCEKLIVGITNPDPNLTRPEATDPQRSAPEANPLTYEELSDTQRDAVDRINRNMNKLHVALLQEGGPGVYDILDSAEVGFKGILVAVNMGDHRARVSVWEDISSDQKSLAAGWWGVTVEQAAALYPVVTYDYMAFHLAALEYLYVVQGVERVFQDRPRLNVERDAARVVAAYIRQWQANDPELTSISNTMAQVCRPMRQQYDSVWAHHYGPERSHQRWFQDNLRTPRAGELSEYSGQLRVQGHLRQQVAYQ